MLREIKCLPYLRLDDKQYIFIGAFKDPVRKGFLDEKDFVEKNYVQIILPIESILDEDYIVNENGEIEERNPYCKRCGSRNVIKKDFNGKAIEHDYLDGVSPIMDEGNKIYREMRVKTPQEFNDILKWHDYIKDYSKNILSGKEEGFTIEMEKRDLENIANFSCIPWVDFDMITNCVLSGNQIQPLITWGKVNEKYEMSISIT